MICLKPEQNLDKYSDCPNTERSVWQIEPNLVRLLDIRISVIRFVLFELLYRFIYNFF